MDFYQRIIKGPRLKWKVIERQTDTLVQKEREILCILKDNEK